MLNKQGYMHTRACTRPCIQTHARTNVILPAFPLQQLFRERASLLRYIYIACLCFSRSCLTCEVFCDRSSYKWARVASIIHVNTTMSICMVIH